MKGTDIIPSHLRNLNECVKISGYCRGYLFNLIWKKTIPSILINRKRYIAMRDILKLKKKKEKSNAKTNTEGCDLIPKIPIQRVCDITGYTITDIQYMMRHGIITRIKENNRTFVSLKDLDVLLARWARRHASPEEKKRIKKEQRRLARKKLRVKYRGVSDKDCPASIVASRAAGRCHYQRVKEDVNLNTQIKYYEKKIKKLEGLQ